MSLEEALQGSPSPLPSEDALRRNLVNPCLKSLRLPLPESSVTIMESLELMFPTAEEVMGLLELEGHDHT